MQIRVNSWLLLTLLSVLFPIDAAAQPAGKMISLQGRAEYRRPGAVPWLPAVNLQVFNNGETLRTLAQTRAVVLLTDETQLKLNQNTTLELRSVRQSSSLLARVVQTSVTQGGQSLLNLSGGQVWLKSKLRPANVSISTPAVTAAIRGTEFDLKVETDGESFISVLEGLVDFRNEQGAVLVGSGEQGRARIGQAPTKSVLLRPRDAVQWTLFYSGAISSSDYQFLNQPPAQLQATLSAAAARRAAADGDVTNLLLLARAQHDLGQKKASEETFRAVLALDPTDREALTDLGWIHLETNRPREAIEQFKLVQPASDRATVALAMAYYRQGEAELFFDTLRRVDPSRSSLAATQRAFSELLYGNVDEARRLLAAIAEADPNYSVAQGLLSNVLLAQNEKDAALAAAQRAVSSGPRSPSAYINLSLAQQSFFQIDEALESARRALELDPDFIQAQVQVAKLLFATGDTAAAERIVRQGLARYPGEAALNSLLGFILLAQAKTEESKTYFNQSIAQDSTRGEPHLGLGIASMRHSADEDAVTSMLVASTLEPQISLYQSYLGKAFYELRRFEMAFDSLNSAVSLDEKDPTPHLYKGIFYNDLSQPGNAVRAFVRSIELNDNRAVYRSRFLLDEDRATRNVNLATAYNRLGLYEWGNYEALKTQMADLTNSSGHIFLAWTFRNLRGRTQAFGSEQLLARLLLPVNANSFNSFNDYTTLFEEPEVNWTSAGQVGSFNRRSGTLISTGGTARFAFGALASYFRSDGFRPVNNDRKNYDAVAQFKFALTPHSDLLVLASHGQQNAGDVARGIIDLESDPNLRVFDRRSRIEVGYHRQFRPGSDGLLYFSADRFEVVRNDPDFFRISFVAGSRSSSREPNLNLQATHLYKTGPFQFRYGIEFFDGRQRVRRTSYYHQEKPPYELENAIERQDVRFRNAFLHTDLIVNPRLVVTGALHYDWANDNNFEDIDYDTGLKRLRSISKWNPQAGVFYSPWNSTTFRFAAFRALQTHFRERLSPSNIHGFVISQNDFPFSQNTSYNFGWDQRVFSTSFVRASAFWRDRRTPLLVDLLPSTIQNRFHGGAVIWNQVLGERWSLVPEYAVSRNNEGFGLRHEHEARIGLYFVDPRRYWFTLRENFIRQGGHSGRTRIRDKFFTTDLNATYELPHKRGLVSFDVMNLFNRRFKLLVDPLALDPRIPRRQATLTLRLNF